MKAVVFLADGFEECEALITVDISRNIKVIADAMAADVDFDSADLIVLPGGRLGTENMAKSSIVAEKCREFAAAEGKYLAAICAAPSLPAALGLLEGKKATCHPDFEGQMAGAKLTGTGVAVDGNIITGQGLGATFDFAFQLVSMLVSEECAEQIKKAICYK